MGCDIHMHTEQRINGKWINVGRGPTEDRDYALFCILAGVRYGVDLPPIAEPKGFPPDAAKKTLKDFQSWGSDAHSTSFLTLREIVDYFKVHFGKIQDGQIVPYFWNDCVPKLKRCRAHKDCRKYPELGAACGTTDDSVRIVFWFDN